MSHVLKVMLNPNQSTSDTDKSEVMFLSHYVLFQMIENKKTLSVVASLSTTSTELSITMGSMDLFYNVEDIQSIRHVERKELAVLIPRPYYFSTNNANSLTFQIFIWDSFLSAYYFYTSINISNLNI